MDKTKKQFLDYIEQQSETNPEGIAIQFDKQEINYKSLIIRVNQVAQALLIQGVSCGQVIGMYLQKNDNLVIIILALLKIGASYLLLDGNNPFNRIKLILENATPDFIILSKEYSNNRDELNKIAFKVILEDELLLTNLKHINVLTKLPRKKETIAYIMYTSGTTGEPKGVIITLKNLNNLILDMHDRISMRKNDRFLSIASIGFDIVNLEFFLPLVAGATLVLSNYNLKTNPRELLSFINQTKITVMQATPATWELLLNVGWKPTENFKILCGGDNISEKIAKKLAQKSGFWHLYGPTETTIWSTAGFITKRDSQIHIGQSIKNTQTYILNKNMDFVREGELGELYISGEGVSPGYYKDEKLTRKFFITDILNKNKKMYKTGDIVIALPDGNIKFITRNDFQFKINGNRVNLLEIENALNQYLEVKTSIVIVDKEEKITRIVAFVLLNSEAKTETVVMKIKKHLASNLPNYMIPSLIQIVDEIPLTLNGKIDREKLYFLLNERKKQKNIYTLNKFEEKILSIWSKVFRETISLYCNFFDIGGTSFQAINICGLIFHELKISINATAIYQNPTPLRLAEYLKSLNFKKKDQCSITLNIDKNEILFPQYDIWLAESMLGESSVYNVPVVFRIKGSLEVEKLKKSLETLLKIKSGLLFQFSINKKGKPVAIYKDTTLLFNKTTFSNHKIREAETLAKKEIEKFIEIPFSLNNAILIKFLLIEINEKYHYLTILFHHILADNWVIHHFLEKLSQLYDLPNVKEESLYSCNINTGHGRYLKKYNQYIYSSEYLSDVAYWSKFISENDKQQIMGMNKESKLSLVHSLFLNKKYKEEIFNLTKRENISLFSTLLTCFSILMNRYSGEESLTIGIPTNLRFFGEFSDYPAMLLNTLPIRISNSLDKSVLSHIKDTHDEIIKIQQHSRFSLQHYQETKKISNKDLFQMTFSFEEDNIKEVNLGDAQIEICDYFTPHTYFNLSMLIRDTKEGLKITCKYAIEAFSHNFIIKLMEDYLNLLKSLKSYLNKKVEKINFSSIDESKYLANLCFSSNSTVPEINLITLFEQQVQRDPNAIAIKLNEEFITYSELSNLSRKYANQLKQAGVVRADRVIVSLPQSIALIASYLAILRLRATYVYVESGLPECYLSNLLSDVDPKVIIISKKIKSFLSKQLKSIQIENFDLNLTDLNNDFPRSDDLAYIIYTSGTTGKPKGVMIEHKSIISLMYKPNFVSIQAREVIAQTSDLSFDGTVFEIWGALLNGGAIAFIDKLTLLEPKKLFEMINKLGIDHMFMTTSLFNQLVASDPTIFSRLKNLLIGGEAANKTTINTVLAQGEFSPEKIINGYGPTEATCFASSITFYRGEYITDLSIGTAIRGRAIFILNKKLQLVPDGVNGEICIGGEAIARGYIKNEQLTKERFVKIKNKKGNFFTVYRTGDIGCFLPNGNIQYLGRKDRQVKKNGYRLELEGIEARLRSFQDIKNAAVISKHNEANNITNLFAFISLKKKFVSEKEKLREKEKIKEIIQNSFSQAMQPDEIIILDEIPLTKTGKIDYLYLDKHDFLDSKSTQNIEKNNKESAEIIRLILQDILQKNTISKDDNFFDIGLTSLSILRFCSLVNNKLNTSFKIVDFFKYTTINKLANCIEEPKNNLPLCLTLKNKFVPDEYKADDIAVIGYSFRFPNCEDDEKFWEILATGKTLIKKYPNEILLEQGVPKELLYSPEYRAFSGIIENIDLFDASFFGFSQRAAEFLDPHHRIFLELAWKALEATSHISSRHRKKIGIFAGMSESGYQSKEKLKDFSLFSKEYNEILFLTNSSFLATQTAYRLGLNGPAVNIDTACSSSLVSVIEACKSLLNGESDIALAGGISLLMPEQIGYLYQREHIFSGSGCCRPFDNDSDGTVPSSGAGIIVCRRLKDAIIDEDNILAVIKGYGINNDGANKAGFFTPSVKGQQDCITQAIKKANISPTSVSYVEAHGTATKLGDMIEIEALKNAYGKKEHENRFLGALKANIGHTNYASGIAGLIKIILMMQKKLIPPLANFKEKNEALNLEDTLFKINKELLPWKSENKLYAGISSFGVGGTNAHMIITEAPLYKKEYNADFEEKLFLLSGKDAITLKSYKETVLNFLIKNKNKNNSFYLDQLTYTSQVAREHFKYRFVAVVRTMDGLIDALKNENFNIPNDSDLSGVNFIAQSWLAGKNVNFSQLLYKNNKPELTYFPGYPFNHQRYWISSLEIVEKKKNISIETSKIVNKNDDIVKEKLIHKWKYLLGVDDFNIDYDFFSLGGDSLLALDLLVFIEKEFGIRCDLNVLLKNNTIESQIKLIASEMSSKRNSSFVCFNKGKNKPPIIFIHPIGGSLFSFIPLIHLIDKTIPIYGIQDPLICSQFIEFNSLEEMASYYIKEIKKCLPAGPYILAGYSAGGTIAFEMARQLISEGNKIFPLIMFDAWSAFPPNVATPNSLRTVIERQLDSLKLHFYPEFESHKPEWFKVLWNRLTILATYCPSMLNIELLLFKSTDLFGEYELIAEHNKKHIYSNGWEKLVNNVDTINIPGHHEEMFKSENISLLYNSLKLYVEKLHDISNYF